MKRRLVAIGAGLVLALSMLSTASPVASAASTPPPSVAGLGAAAPLASMLNPDGTLATSAGRTEALDPKGYRMELTGSGAPKFVKTSHRGESSPADTSWDDRFGLRGVGFTVYTIAVSGNDVYVGGYFTADASLIPNSAFNHVAHWNGRSWVAMGTGVNGSVHGLAVVGTDVYAVGEFTSAGSVAANHVARWNGSTWSALGTGLTDASPSDTVAGTAVVAFGGEVVAAGEFDTAGGVAANSIAAWNGTSWSALGDGIQTCVGCGGTQPGEVDALAVSPNGSTLYVGGSFQKAGTVVTNSIAAWNGTTWSALSTGIGDGFGSDGQVKALAVDGSDLYVGGHFGTAGSLTVASLAKWNGTGFSAVSTGVTQYGSTSTVSALVWTNGKLYIGGSFDTAVGVLAQHLVTWDGATGATVGANNLSDDPTAIAVAPGGGVEVGGAASVDGIQANYIARWSGTAWSVLGKGISGQYGNAGGTVNAVAGTGDGSTYAGGTVGQAGGTEVAGIARWNGTDWDDVGGGVTGGGQDGNVYAIAVDGSDIYVGGAFDTAGGVSAANIAKWNGTSWSALGSGTNDAVFALLITGGELYVGGAFSAAGGTAASGVARMNLSTGTWSPLGDGPTFSYVGGSAGVHALAVVDSRYIVVGGDFASVGPSGSSVTVNGLVYWDSQDITGSPTNPLGGWYMGGGGVTISGGSVGTVSALAVAGETVYVGGTFATAGDNLDGRNQIAADGIAELDLAGQQWSALGNGIGGGLVTSVEALELVGPTLYVGGDFTTAGSAPAAGIATFDTASSAWSSLGSGVTDPDNARECGCSNGAVDALEVTSGVLSVGGSFSVAGTHLSQNFGQYQVSSSEGGATNGMLRVTTSPAVPSQILVNGHIADTWGLQWVKEPAGSYTVCFTPVAGYTTPDCQTVTVTNGATTSIVGQFTERGYLKVVTSPALPSQITVDGHPADDWGVYTDIPAGSHTVCFGAVQGFDPPACQTVTITAGATKTVTGMFTANSAALGQTGVGFLRVTTSPAVPAQILLDGNIADSWGLNWLEVASGSHTVCFSSLASYTAPACQTVTVTAGATTTVTGTFGARGYLKVVTNPAVSGTISIDGHAADDWGVYTDVPVGPHTVCFGDIAGHTTPACQTVTATAGSTATVTGTYT